MRHENLEIDTSYYAWELTEKWRQSMCPTTILPVIRSRTFDLTSARKGASKCTCMPLAEFVKRSLEITRIYLLDVVFRSP